MLPNDGSKMQANMMKPRDFKKCACGRSVIPSESKCEECLKTQHYFKTSDKSQPHDLGEKIKPGY